MSRFWNDEWGFQWGPMRVVRYATFRHNRILGVETDHRRLEVSVSTGGRSVRVWLDGRELK